MLLTDDHPDHQFRRLYCGTCGHPVDVPILCADRFCWLCSRIRAAKIRRRLRFILKNLSQLPGYFPAMITLSVQNSPDLEAQVKHLIASFRRLRQTRSWKFHVAGGATIIEIKMGKDGWHAHIHAIVYMQWYPFKKLLKNWERASGGSQVFITRVSHDKAIYYTTKYVSKSELTGDDKVNASSVLKRYRLFQRFGDWSMIRLPKLYSDAQCDKCGEEGFVFILDKRSGTVFVDVGSSSDTPNTPP